MIQRQDEHLDEVHAAVERLGHLSLNIHNELEAQEVMLGDAEAAVSEARAAMDDTTRRINVLIEANGGRWWCGAMAALSCIAFVLFLLILWNA